MKTFGIIALSALCILLILAIVIIIVTGMNMLAEEFKQPKLTIDGREYPAKGAETVGTVETVRASNRGAESTEDDKGAGAYKKDDKTP